MKPRPILLIIVACLLLSFIGYSFLRRVTHTAELVESLAVIANKHGLQVSDEQKKVLFYKFIKMDFQEMMKPTPGGP